MKLVVLLSFLASRFWRNKDLGHEYILKNFFLEKYLFPFVI